MKLQMEIGQLAKIIEEYNHIQLQNNQEVSIDNLDIQIDTPTGISKIHYIIKKTSLDMLMITLNNGYTFRCAENHILMSDTHNIYAKDLRIGSLINHKDGFATVESIEFTGKDDCLDINVDSPNMYYDSNGVVHHNTLITAILSHKVQPYGRSIVIVPTKDLVTQTEEDYINMGLDVGVYFGDRKEYRKTHTICTWQSLEVLSKKSKEEDLEVDIEAFFENVVCVMVDECFHEDSGVLTLSGYKKISEISVGDRIINYSEKTGIFKEDVVDHIYKNLTKSSNEKMYELCFDNGSTIKVTGNHKFLTHRGWVKADQLTQDDDIKSIKR